MKGVNYGYLHTFFFFFFFFFVNLNQWHHRQPHPELSGCITTHTVSKTEIANFCAAMDTLIDQDEAT